MNLLFLDLDGVLNCHEFDPQIKCGQIHKDKVGRLNDVLKATGARVVLSSAWRYLVHREEMTLKGLEWLLRSHGVLADRLIGITRPDTMRTHTDYDGVPHTWPVDDERGRQIRDWLNDTAGNVFDGWNPKTQATVRRYAVVDDLDLGITAAGHPFVKTDGTVGLTDADAAKLVELLCPRGGR